MPARWRRAAAALSMKLGYRRPAASAAARAQAFDSWVSRTRGVSLFRGRFHGGAFESSVMAIT